MLLCLCIFERFMHFLIWNLSWQAAELLRHPHLQAYVLKIHLKSNSPRYNTLPICWSEPNHSKKFRFPEPEDAPISTYREKRQSFCNDRNLNPSISGAEQDFLSSAQRKNSNPVCLNQRLVEISFGSTHEETTIIRSVASKSTNITKTPRLTPAKASATPKRWTEPSKDRELVSSCWNLISRTQAVSSLKIDWSEPWQNIYSKDGYHGKSSKIKLLKCRWYFIF